MAREQAVAIKCRHLFHLANFLCRDLASLQETCWRGTRSVSADMASSGPMPRQYPSAYANIESVHGWVLLTIGVTPLSSLIKINTSAFLTWPNPWPGSQGKKKSGHLHSHITIKITQSRIFQGVFRKLCETTGLTLVKKPLELCTCVIVPPTLVVVFECLLSSAEERRRSRFWKQNCVCMRVYNKSLTLLLLVVVVLHALRIYWAQALPSHHPMPNVAAALLYSTRHQAGGGQGGQAPPGIIDNKC